jgi:hypothetical protein
MYCRKRTAGIGYSVIVAVVHQILVDLVEASSHGAVAPDPTHATPVYDVMTKNDFKALELFSSKTGFLIQ